MDVVTDVLDTSSRWRCCSRLRGVSITADNSLVLDVVHGPKKRGGNGKENPATCLIAIQRKYFSTFLRSRKVPADCASIYRCNFLFVGRLRPSGRGSFEARIYFFFKKKAKNGPFKVERALID